MAKLTWLSMCGILPNHEGEIDCWGLDTNLLSHVISMLFQRKLLPNCSLKWCPSRCGNSEEIYTSGMLLQVPCDSEDQGKVVEEVIKEWEKCVGDSNISCNQLFDTEPEHLEYTTITVNNIDAVKCSG